LDKGVVTRLICESEEANVNLFNTYDTPVF
jgi:hypothetical protein